MADEKKPDAPPAVNSTPASKPESTAAAVPAAPSHATGPEPVAQATQNAVTPPKPAAPAPAAAPPAPPKIPAPIPFHAQPDRATIDQHEPSADGSRPNGSDREWIGYAQQGGGSVPEHFGVFHSGKEEQDELM